MSGEGSNPQPRCYQADLKSSCRSGAQAAVASRASDRILPQQQVQVDTCTLPAVSYAPAHRPGRGGPLSPTIERASTQHPSISPRGLDFPCGNVPILECPKRRPNFGCSLGPLSSTRPTLLSQRLLPLPAPLFLRTEVPTAIVYWLPPMRMQHY